MPGRRLSKRKAVPAAVPAKPVSEARAVGDVADLLRGVVEVPTPAAADVKALGARGRTRLVHKKAVLGVKPVEEQTVAGGAAQAQTQAQAKMYVACGLPKGAGKKQKKYHPVLDVDKVIAGCEREARHLLRGAERDELEACTLHGPPVYPASLSLSPPQHFHEPAVPYEPPADTAALPHALDAVHAAAKRARATLDSESESESGAPARATLDDDDDDEATSSVGYKAPQPPAKRPKLPQSGRAGFDESSDEASSSEAGGEEEAAAAMEDTAVDEEADADDHDEDMLAGVPLARFTLPPEPSRQPHLALAHLHAGDRLAIHGANVRVKVLKGALGVCGGVVPAGEWVTVWGGETGYAMELSPAERVGGTAVIDPMQECPAHPLLGRAPERAEYEWAASRAERLSAAAGGVAEDGRACILLLAAANRAPLLEYLHSFHPSPSPQLLGPILDRLAHGARQARAKFTLPEGYAACLAHARAARAPRVAIIGNGNTGKSTLARALVNGLLGAGRVRVVYIDTDLGQCEFTAPGCVSLTVVTHALAGPSYTHQVAPRHVAYLAATTCQTDPFAWCRALVEMLQKYAADPLLRDAPLVVNTHGWTHSLGLRCLSEALQKVAPTLVAVTGGVGFSRGGDMAAAEELKTQESRALQLLKYESGLCASFTTHYGIDDCAVYGSPDALCGAAAFSEVVPQVVLVDVPAAKAVKSKGWWARQALLTMSVTGRVFNDFRTQTSCAAQGHAQLRSFFQATCPYEVPLDRVRIYLHNVEWEAGLVDACPRGAVLTKMERTIVALYAGAFPGAAPAAGVTVSPTPPPAAATLVGFALVAAAAAAPDGGRPRLYVVTPADPLALVGVDCVVGGMPAPAAWFDAGADNAAAVVGRGVLSSRQGAR
eukprot:TRINITY_DN3772_c0_g1_i1.p1 TRINITY_DN3772_c0_g1~~TRINITY_DN3772_c0_g1_i1.p1  ORF type:complete len:887 (+),score=321.56 TRINITY_DN3772_c0_g1_i1:91-2751(+)